MRNVLLGVGISLDGYIARKDGSVDFLFMPKDYSMAPFFERIDAAIMGRKTWDVSKSMGGGSFGPSIKTYVMSKTVSAGTQKGITFTSDSPRTVVAEIRRQPGKDIWLMGGGELAAAFLQEDLIDELHLGIVPCVLGGGLPLFPPGFPQRDFDLVESKTYSKGLLTVQYKRTAKKRARKS